MRKPIRIERHKLIDLLKHVQFLSEMADQEPTGDELSDDVADDPLPDVTEKRLISDSEEPKSLEKDREPSCD